MNITRFFRAAAVMPAAMCILAAALAASCGDDSDNGGSKAKTSNPAANITDSKKLAMLRSMRDVEGNGGRLYEINYTADYKLDQVLASGITETNRLFAYIGSILYDTIATRGASATYGAGCSAFAVRERADGGDFLMGRNYDFRHAAKSGGYQDIAAIVVHTAPKGGKKSVSIVDGLNLNYGRGFYTDGTTDLSLLMGLPYAALDGINEDGFAIGVLALSERQTTQSTGKTKISTTVAIRMLLDHASTVDDAIAMLRNYDMDMNGQGSSNYHFYMADANGGYAIVEYTFPQGDSIPRDMEVLRGNDTLRCVTNFYVSPTMIGTNDGWGSDHGRDRYFAMRDTLAANNYHFGSATAWKLLDDVSQPPTEKITSQTQWSALYNLSDKSLRLSILREYGKKYKFRVRK